MHQAADSIFSLIKVARLAFDRQVLAGAGAVSIDKTLTFCTNTTTQATTLAKGREGQLKIIVQTVAGGTNTCTPVGGVSAGTTIAFASVGLVWFGIFAAGKWYTIYSTATVA